MSVSAKVILLVGHDETLHDLIEFGNSWGLHTYQRKDRLLHYQIPTSLSACGSVFFFLKILEGTDVDKCKGRTFG
jgi:hypothetical protein